MYFCTHIPVNNKYSNRKKNEGRKKLATYIVPYDIS